MCCDDDDDDNVQNIPHCYYHGKVASNESNLKNKKGPGGYLLAVSWVFFFFFLSCFLLMNKKTNFSISSLATPP